MTSYTLSIVKSKGRRINLPAAFVCFKFILEGNEGCFPCKKATLKKIPYQFFGISMTKSNFRIIEQQMPSVSCLNIFIHKFLKRIKYRQMSSMWAGLEPYLNRRSRLP